MFTSPNKIKEENPSVAPSRIEERLVNAERFLNVNVDGMRNVYERIKHIEDRILHLETVSPEYKHFLVNQCFVIGFFFVRIENIFFAAKKCNRQQRPRIKSPKEIVFDRRIGKLYNRIGID